MRAAFVRRAHRLDELTRQPDQALHAHARRRRACENATQPTIRIAVSRS